MRKIKEIEKNFEEVKLDIEYLLARLKELENEIKTHENLEVRLLEDKCKNWLDWKQTESRFHKLEEAIEKHKWAKWGSHIDNNGKHYFSVLDEFDEELYKSNENL